MFKLLKRLKFKDWLLVIFIVAGTICQVACEMELIEQMGEVIALIQYGTTRKKLILACLEMLGFTLGVATLGMLSSFASSYVSSKLANVLRQEMFDHVNSFSQEEINLYSVPSLITRTTNDINQVQQTFQMCTRNLVMAPTMAAFAIGNIINNSIELSLVTAGAVGILFVALILIVVFVIPCFSKIQKATDRINSVSRESLTGIRVVRAYNAEKYQEDKFEEVNADVTNKSLFVNRVFSFMGPTMTLIMNGLSLIIYWFGAALINKGGIEYSSLAIFSQYSMHVVMSFMVISMTLTMIPRGFVSSKRINEVLDKDGKIKDGLGNRETKGYGSVEFKNVSFKYPGAEEYVIENVSFKASKGETVAFIGSTGSGKSTLINLIPRFYDVTEGKVLVDGVNVKDYKLEDLRNKMGYVPQKGVLFSGTIESNIRYGNAEATDKEIENALEVSQAKEFVSKLDEGLNYKIAQGGTNVSGGQRQRLCIARAVVRNPEIFIFDDSFSALDYKTDKILRAALKEKTRHSTKLIVAQRIGTIIDADLIVVLDEGKVVGMGKHQELLKNCDVYREIALSQLSEEELAYGK